MENMTVFNNLNPSVMSKDKARQLNPQSLAFVGDSVHTLYVRSLVMGRLDVKSHALHKEAKNYVMAAAQSASLEKVILSFSEEETAIYKRGRNTKTKFNAKSASAAEYHRATGLEAVLGFLFLTEQYSRLEEILKLLTD